MRPLFSSLQYMSRSENVAAFHSPFSPPLPDSAQMRPVWQRLYGSALGLALTQVATERLIVVAAADARRAQRLESQVLFFAAGRDVPVYAFPDWECLPYDNFSPHQDIISQRLLTLHRLPELKCGIVILPVANLMQRLAPPAFVQSRSFSISMNDRIDIDALRRQLGDVGYQSVGQVFAPGEFSVRGNVIDIFPMGQAQPFRLDLFDDVIETIRHFDPESQRSTDVVDSINLLPAREFPTDEAGITRFRQAFRAEFEGDPQKSDIYRDVSKGLLPPGIEFYLPLFFDHTVSLFDYLPPAATLILDDGAATAIARYESEVRDRFELVGATGGRALLRPERLFLSAPELEQRVLQWPRIQIAALATTGAHTVQFNARAVPEFLVNVHSDAPYTAFLDFVRQYAGRLLLVAESPGRREVLTGMLRDHSIDFAMVENWSAFHADNGIRLGVTVAGDIEEGLALEDPPITVLTETQLYGEKVFQRRRRSAANRDPDAIIRSLAELKVGDPIVHDDHGVGRYRGLSTLSIENNQNEFLVLEYQDGDKLYIPVLSLGVVSRYIGAGAETAPLHKLGSEQWLRAKAKAAERAYDVAAELLEVQALRNSRNGHAFGAPDDSYAAFTAAFPFEETPDQDQVIDDVIRDMTGMRPMDRLVCGDVGFGKTEIALRAAYLAVHDGKQVAVLVPTTLLAQQHFRTFSDRFADFPVKVELMSRFRTSAQLAEAARKLADGTIDVVIGTHRLLQRDIHFKRLGLVILDEEHRFGVRQKERLKQMRSEVDVLTLTATPIPRTLNAAISGLRDISIIGTPPRARLSIKTFVREWAPSLVREACLREIRRGGQVYFLHNEVRTMEKMLETLTGLVPEAQILVAHGQMPETELESVMRDFYHLRFNILLCSTIIESGIDVPTANTIIINRADRFGLAQLHQLRGRVGRSHHQAYAYLITPPRRALTGDALKRLQAIESLEDLGAGFALASHDLEIRGAGELLGEAQSGMIDEIGFTMYTEFLNRAIAHLARGSVPDRKPPSGATEVDLHVPALFPQTYLPDVDLRLVMYKRISAARDREELDDLQAEVIDRFGPMPDPARNLFRIAELRSAIAPLSLRRVDIGVRGGRLEFSETQDMDPVRIVRLIESLPGQVRMQGGYTLVLKAELPELDDRIGIVRDIAAQLIDPSLDTGAAPIRH